MASDAPVAAARENAQAPRPAAEFGPPELLATQQAMDDYAAEARQNTVCNELIVRAGHSAALTLSTCLCREAARIFVPVGVLAQQVLSCGLFE